MPTVYVADRDAAHRRELTQAFRRRGFRAFEFASGSDLYASVIAGAPDLVTLDVDLDEMDGFQVFARLLRKRDTRPLPLVFVSDFQNAHVVEVCIQRGALGYLRKGDMADLVAAAAEDLLGDVRDVSPDEKLAATPDDEPHAAAQPRKAAKGAAAPTPKASPAARRARWKRWAVFAACMLVAALGFALGPLIISRLPSPGTAAPRKPARRPAPATGAAVDAGRAEPAPAVPASNPLPELLELYTRAGLAFERRVVRMDGRYEGIERTVARARISQDGREATLMVTHPGIDLTEESLVPATSLRIDVRE